MEKLVYQKFNYYNYVNRIEEIDTSLDYLNNFEWFNSEIFWDAPIFQPIVDNKINDKIPGFKEKIVWPEGHSYAVCLSHDIDMLSTFSWIEHWRRMRVRWKHDDLKTNVKNLSGLRHPTKSVDIFSPWLEIEKQYGFKSTFFIMSDRIIKRDIRDNTYNLNDTTFIKNESRNFLEFLKEINSLGWEIGIHGSINSAYITDEFLTQKNYLEDHLGFRILSSRFHNLSFNRAVTPQILDKAGIMFDSTLGSNRMIGFRSGTSYPHHLALLDYERESGFLEIPLLIQDGAVLRTDNLGLIGDYAFQICRKIIDRVRYVNGIVTLNWHPNVSVIPEWLNLYLRLLEYIKDTNGWASSFRTVGEWWISNEYEKVLKEGLNRLR